MRTIRMAKILIKEDGAVTVFAVVILSALLLFFSVLIDYARIAAFQLMSENAARAGVRSVLSAYDSWLFERYGLFGRGGTDGSEIFSEVMKASVGSRPFGSDEGMELVASTLDSSKLLTASTLGEHDVFARQVLEDMKYKAPIDFTLELVAKFTPMSQALRESSNAIQTLEQLRKLYERREDLLEKAVRLQEQAVQILIDSEALALVPAGRALSGSGSGTSAALAEGYGQYAAQAEHDASVPEGGEALYGEEIAAYEREVADLTKELRSGSNKLELKHAELLTEASQKVEEAERINGQMKLIIAQADTASGAGYGNVANAKAPGSGDYAMPDSTAKELEEIRKSGDKLLRTAEWFAGYKAELLEQGTNGTAVTSEIEQLLGRWSGAMSAPNSLAQASLLLSVAEIGKALQKYEQLYSLPGQVLKDRRDSVLDVSFKSKLAEQKRQTASKWTEANRMLQGLAGVPARPDHQAIFDQARTRFEQNLLFNQHAASASEAYKLNHPEDASAAAEQSATRMDGMFAGMSDMLLQGRDAYYFGEYAAGRYSYFEPQQLRGLLANGDVDGVSQTASFHNQELEYVLYGFHDPMGNLIAAYGELFSVRLAVRTMEGLIESRALGHPLLVLSAAILYGLEKTMEDMLSFAEKGSAPLSKYIKVELTYLDYLRLFIMMHRGDEEQRLGRMIAVIEQNTGLQLSSVPVGVTAEAKVSMKLWFLPGIMSMLGRLDLLQGKVIGSRYETTQTVGWSY
ncbi:TadE/TadG family type IV pilus assembly protein [Paenibacillus soyae]|uniref:Uncharacterized protein n=1 Tax=Paenibacillus soyae TaxID=2969249 RepID=A0A9X2MIE6_9BACL|nr:hypothetical protein [Paenibacillus soyae]MCR2802348.1 hypothetical protein [Paenibacillus soyae]